MAIDFSNPKEYLESKFDDLKEGIGETYGSKLMEELDVEALSGDEYDFCL